MTKRQLKGQIHLTETIAVLFIFFVLVFFGIVFYYKYSQVAVAEKQEELLGKRAVETTIKTLFMPELICTKGDAVAEDNCFDLMKVKYAQQTFDRHMSDYYFDVFSYANITIIPIYPPAEKIIVYEHAKPNATRIEPTYFVVTLKDEKGLLDKPRYGFGYVKVEVYS